MAKFSKQKRDTKKKKAKEKENKEHGTQEPKKGKIITYDKIVNNDRELKQAFDKVFGGFFGADKSVAMKPLKKEIKQHQEDYVELRKEIIEAIGEPTEEGSNKEFEFEGKALEQVQREFRDLDGTEIEIKSKKIRIPVRLITAFNNEISTNDMTALEPFIEFVEKENKRKGKKKGR